MKNLFENIPDTFDSELFETILYKGNVRIERIISFGQATPQGEWLRQEDNEWVVLIEGEAELLFDDGFPGICMKPGDHIFIEARRKHRVERTSVDRRSVWLAVHFPAQ